MTRSSSLRRAAALLLRNATVQAEPGAVRLFDVRGQARLFSASSSRGSLTGAAPAPILCTLQQPTTPPPTIRPRHATHTR
jgi:hypothetical protein